MSGVDWYVEATTRSVAAVRLDLTETYGQFNRLRHTGRGVVH